MTSQMYGALWAHGARTDRAWAQLQARNVALLRARGRATGVHPAPVPVVRPYLNDSRWVIDCACRNGVIVDVGFGTGRCFECGAVYTERQIRLPKHWAAIERDLLRLYPHDSTLRDWRPGQTLTDLRGRHHSWTAPRTWVTGELVTAAIGNTHWRDNFLETGPAKVTTALDMLYATAANALARVGGGTAYQVPRVNSGATAIEFADQFLRLLKANSSTSTTTSANNLDTVAISGLTAKDTLLVFADIEAVTQAGGETFLYNATDAANMPSVAPSAHAAGEEYSSVTRIRQSQAGATAINGACFRLELDGPTLAGSSNAPTTFTTAWTGSWTLALRNSGVTAGGTLRWSWAVFIARGQ